jgi:hypothetical protein
MARSGLRIGEALELDWQQVYVAGAMLHVRQQAWRGKQRTLTERHIPRRSAARDRSEGDSGGFLAIKRLSRSGLLFGGAAGVPVGVIWRLMRHSNLQMTRDSRSPSCAVPSTLRAMRCQRTTARCSSIPFRLAAGHAIIQEPAARLPRANLGDVDQFLDQVSR